MLAADGSELAFATMPTASDCDRVFIWESLTHRVAQLGQKQRCKVKSLGVSGLGVTKGRAMWLTTSSGPTLSTVKLWTATTKRPTPRQLLTANVASGDEAPIIVGKASGGLLPYAQDTAVTVLRSDGKSFNWTATDHVVGLAARGGQVAVAQDGNRVTVLDSNGNVVSVDLYTSAVNAVALTSKGQLVQRGTTLELRRGADAHDYTMSATGVLDDADARWAVWSDGKFVHVIRLPDGAQVGVYPGTTAALSGSTLYVANGKTIAIRTIR